MKFSTIPDYADSLLRAEQHLRRCHSLIIDRKDLPQAQEMAKVAQRAVNDLVLDLELRLAGVRR